MYVVSLYESRLCVVLEVNATKKVVKVKKKMNLNKKKSPKSIRWVFFYTCTYDSRLLFSMLLIIRETFHDIERLTELILSREVTKYSSHTIASAINI